MLKKRDVFRMLLYIGILCSGCNPRPQFIYEMNIGRTIERAIKVDVVEFGTQIDETGKNVIAAVLSLQITNVGKENINLERDITITATQGNSEAVLKTNTILEGNILEPQRTGSYEVGFEFIGTGDVEVVFKFDNQIESFIITTHYPAEIIKRE